MGKSAASVVDLETRIVSIRGLSVLLDADLAVLYGVSTKALLQAVRRNPERFPSDFMFQLSNQELGILRSQFVTSRSANGHGGRRALPYAFTEQGVAMLSSVLRSETAVRVNVEIMRAFVRLRRASLLSTEIMKLVEDLSNRVDSHDQVIGDIVESIRQLAVLPPRERSRPIGFTADLEADSST
jgi:ORF6N domain